MVTSPRCIMKDVTPSPEKKLVQDLHCYTYISKETVINATIDGEVRHFCSRE